MNQKRLAEIRSTLERNDYTYWMYDDHWDVAESVIIELLVYIDELQTTIEGLQQSIKEQKERLWVLERD